MSCCISCWKTEKGGIEIYETALRCAVNADLKQEWEDHLQQTLEHEQMLEVMDRLGLDRRGTLYHTTSWGPEAVDRVARHACRAAAAGGRA